MATKTTCADLRARTDLLRDMHRPIASAGTEDPEDAAVCFDCSQIWPCRVIRVLDGEITSADDATTKVE